MEAKILAATLASLAAVFAGLNGGAFTADDITNTGLTDQEITQQNGLQSMLPDIPLLDQLRENPEPTNNVKAEIQIRDRSDLKLRQSSITASNLSQIKSNRMKIQSDKEIILRDFTGKIQFDNTTKIKGSSTGLNSSGVNITTAIKLDSQFSTNKIDVKNTYRSKMEFSKASISPTENSDFGINAEETKLNINSFTGDITVYTENKTLIIDGKIDTLTAGKYSLGN